MTESWHNTETDLEVDQHATDFWSRHRAELQNGEFWADRIKNMKGEPAQRLALALENMPLPAAFREAAIATRALIRKKRNEKNEYSEELALLYWLAAINSFSIPYSQILDGPGYNVVASVPGKKLKSLPFSYKTLGYKKLEILNKTDIKWLVELWGEPNDHTTLHEMHNHIWREYEEKLQTQRKNRDQEFTNGLRKFGATENQLPSPHCEPKNVSLGKWLFIAIFVAVLIAVVRNIG